MIVVAVLAQSFTAMIVVVARVVAGDRSTVTSAFNRHSVFVIAFGCFSRIKKLLGRTETRTRE